MAKCAGVEWVVGGWVSGGAYNDNGGRTTHRGASPSETVRPKNAERDRATHTHTHRHSHTDLERESERETRTERERESTRETIRWISTQKERFSEIRWFQQEADVIHTGNTRTCCRGVHLPCTTNFKAEPGHFAPCCEINFHFYPLAKCMHTK